MFNNFPSLAPTPQTVQLKHFQGKRQKTKDKHPRQRYLHKKAKVKHERQRKKQRDIFKLS